MLVMVVVVLHTFCELFNARGSVLYFVSVHMTMCLQECGIIGCKFMLNAIRKHERCSHENLIQSIIVFPIRMGRSEDG